MNHNTNTILIINHHHHYHTIYHISYYYNINSPDKKQYAHLKNTELPLFIVPFAAIAYILFVVSKLLATVTEINGGMIIYTMPYYGMMMIL